MFKRSEANIRLIFLAVGAAVALMILVVFFIRAGSLLASECWQGTIQEVNEFRDAIGHGEEHFELALNPVCALRVELTSNRNRCGQLCNLDDFKGDIEECFEKCTACSAVENAGSYIIALPKIPEGWWDTLKKTVSQPVETFRARFFDDIYCRASREYTFANEFTNTAAFIPTDDAKVFCIAISREPTTELDTVFITIQNRLKTLGGCGYG